MRRINRVFNLDRSALLSVCVFLCVTSSLMLPLWRNTVCINYWFVAFDIRRQANTVAAFVA